MEHTFSQSAPLTLLAGAGAGSGSGAGGVGGGATTTGAGGGGATTTGAGGGATTTGAGAGGGGVLTTGAGAAALGAGLDAAPTSISINFVLPPATATFSCQVQVPKVIAIWCIPGAKLCSVKGVCPTGCPARYTCAPIGVVTKETRPRGPVSGLVYATLNLTTSSSFSSR
ncbi:MAG: hypothetical protein BWX66_01644 [Deltaproteobacteria bacterium ADurb.Bin058]|nr:MAG: hypothetical protein BWX66_01644 [Deltaproteobacteria bacterium ADurb.Bin058]